MAKQKFNLNKKQKKNSTLKNKNNKFKNKAVGKRGRVIIRNLPFSCTEDKLADAFREFGKIVDINVPKHPDSNKPKGFAFVDFTSRLSADKATEAFSGKDFMGRKITIERAVSKDRFLNSENKQNDSVWGMRSNQKEKQNVCDEDSVRDHGHDYDDDINNGGEIKIKEEDCDNDEYDDEFLNDIKEEPLENKEFYKEHGLSDFTDNKDSKNESSSDSKSKAVKQPYEIPKKKKARLIIRNLSFKTTEEKLRSHFSTYGDVIDLNLLRRVDNKLVGCAFLEFNNRKSAVNAIVATSGKPFLGRTIVVDWAIPVKDFKKVNESSSGNAKENDTNEEDGDIKIKEEILSDDKDGDSSSDKEESVANKINQSNDTKEEEISSEIDDNDDENEETDENEEMDASSDVETNSSDDNEEDEYESDVNKNEKKRKLDELSEPVDDKKKPRYESHDVSEGRTVFIKNVPFTATNEDLKECVKQFGPLFYALICIDPITEHSRGTAFVKFQNKEDAEKCLAAGTSFTLNGTILDPHPAIDRDKVKEMKLKRNDKNKDSRNLYLLKEGVVLAGTPAAAGVSMSDMAHRLQLEQLKTQMLKNLNMFISRNRLIIHNLPASYDNHKLKKLFLKHSKRNAVIQEARVMRDFKNVDGKGIGKSKEYGFVTFKEHEDALYALRNINNNPHVFTISKRPIVAFSVENRRILNLKKKRLEKSKVNNPLCSDYKLQVGKNTNKRYNNDLSRNDKKNKRNKKNQSKENVKDVTIDDKKSYTGVTAKPGSTSLRSKFKLKVQAQLHHKELSKEKKERKKLIKMEPIKAIEGDKKGKNFKSNKKSVEDDVHFSSLVNKYKAQLISDTVRKKWYE
ncbi:RNA-binding protein 28 [Lycorma delicatula]|uniref:RNA-binding protein 28 n=1 Tax=Lycorma delicatula TaxID=130591 RepID=UPI003F513FE2